MNIFSNTNSVIAYTVNKAINNNSLYISVQNGGVVVKAPWYYSQKKIQEIVEEKKKWILEKLQESEEKAIKKKDSSLLKSTKIFGKYYRINIFYKSIKNPTLNLENNCINIFLPINLKNTDNAELLNTILEKMYSSIAQNEIENIMEKTRVSLGFAPEDFEINKTKNLLATCSKDINKITVNPTIVMYKKSIIEFIILHQFCHLKYKTHSKKFIQIMKNHNSNYEKLLEETKDLKY